MSAMKLRWWSLLALRVSLGLLMLIWGIDKLMNVPHAVLVSDHFYFGLFTVVPLLKGFGIVQMALGLLILLGIARRWTYPALLVVTGFTLIGVWRSIVDPWSWYLEGANVLFFPSLIIFAAALVLYAFRDADRYALDARTAQGEALRG